MQIQCCVCRKIREGGAWAAPTGEQGDEAVSHGYCPICAAEAFAEMRGRLHHKPPPERIQPHAATRPRS